MGWALQGFQPPQTLAVGVLDSPRGQICDRSHVYASAHTHTLNKIIDMLCCLVEYPLAHAAVRCRASGSRGDNLGRHDLRLPEHVGGGIQTSSLTSIGGVLVVI